MSILAVLRLILSAQSQFQHVERERGRFCFQPHLEISAFLPCTDAATSDFLSALVLTTKRIKQLGARNGTVSRYAELFRPMLCLCRFSIPPSTFVGLNHREEARHKGGEDGSQNRPIRNAIIVWAPWTTMVHHTLSMSAG